jgi:N-acyl-D-glutamate deacylase
MRAPVGWGRGVRWLVTVAIPVVAACSMTRVRPATAPPYDLVLVGGRVVDPASGLDAIRNVGVRDGTIAAVTSEPLVGARTIDATGQIVAPGFIDLHSHGVSTKTASRMQVQDGVTTQLELESGMLPVAAWYDRLTAEGRPANFGTSVAWTFARAAVLSGLHPEPSIRFFRKAEAASAWKTDPATPEQVDRIVALIDEGLRQGALGVGMNAGYAPGYGMREMEAVHEAAARYPGRPLFYHLRQMGAGARDGAIGSLLEVIGVAQATGTPVHVCHIHSVALQDVGLARRLVASARANGLAITTEAYPYVTMSTIIGAPFLRDPDFPAKLGFGPRDIVYLATGERPASMARLRELQAADPGGIGLMHFFDLTDETQAARFEGVMTDPSIVIASDAMLWQQGHTLLENVWPLPPTALAHPRTAGTFARFLRVWVRERRRVSLMDAIRRTSLLPARVLAAGVPAMRRKGRVAPGADADLVVFDLQTVSDRATFERPAQASAGFSWVIVNGRPVVADGVFDPLVDAGKPVRAPTVG